MTHKKFRDPLQDIRLSKVFYKRVVEDKREPIKLTRLDDLCPVCFWELDDCDCDEEPYSW